MSSLRPSIFATLVLLLCCLSVPSWADYFAYEVVSATGPFGGSPYDDPNSVLGKPTNVVGFSMVFPAYGESGGHKLITTLNPGAEIVVNFDHHVLDEPGNWYGLDFIVYGNPFFGCAEGWVDPYGDMENYHIGGGGIFAEPVTVSVSQDGVNWYTYTSPVADSYYPTNAYAWDRVNHCWGEELDWTKPVNPSLGAADFAGLSVADAIDLYDGSAGGTGFDLAETGYDWIQYMKVHGSSGGEIDGFSDASTPEPSTVCLCLLSMGLAALAANRRRKETQQSL